MNRKKRQFLKNFRLFTFYVLFDKMIHYLNMQFKATNMKQKIILFINILLIVVVGSSCATTPKSLDAQIFAMDTVMSLSVYGENADEAVKAATGEINRLDKMLSANDTDSEVSKVNASAGSFVQVSEPFLRQIAVAKEVYERSGGAFDISVLPLMELWGFGTEKAHVPSDSEIAAAMSKLNFKGVEVSDSSVRIPQGTKITLAAIAKGYTSQRLYDLFRTMGVSSAIVSLGGNVQAVGHKARRLKVARRGAGPKRYGKVFGNCRNRRPRSCDFRRIPALF